jgi:hypothetical protein
MRTYVAIATIALLANCTGFVQGDDDAGLTASGGGAAMGGGTATGGGGSDPTGGGSGGGASGGGNGGGDDAGSSAGGGGGSVDAGPQTIPVFVAVGKQRRRTISCDDGLTWKNDVSVDDEWPMNERYRCFSGNFDLPDGGTQSTDCDHNAYSSTALVYADGAFVQATGWGTPGTFFRSTDGVSWQTVLTGPVTTDLMYGGGRIITATRGSRRSDDRGLTWQNSTDIDVASGANTIWNVRGGAFGGGTFLVTAQDGTNLDFAISSNAGQSWSRPTMTDGGRVDECGAGHPAFGNGIFVTITQSMDTIIICRSSDGAQTWTSTTISNEYFESRPLWTGTEFMFWGTGRVFRSLDGATWTAGNTQTRRNGTLSGGPNIGSVAVNAQGTFVAVKGGWQTWYEQQRFYRSTDGVIWDELATGNYTQGHPITAIVAGSAERSTICP